MVRDKHLLTRLLKIMLNSPTLRSPFHAQVEITNLCNLDCKMCFRHFIEIEPKHMDFELFKKIVDRLVGVNSISLCGYGEPLFYPHIFAAIRYCKYKNFEVQMTSNGLLLDTDEKAKELILSGLGLATFSFESINTQNEITHPNFKAQKNVQRLIELKKEMHSFNPHVTVQTMMLKGREEDLFDVIRWAASVGVERVNVSRFEKLNTLNNVERPNLKEEKQIFKKFSELRRKLEIRIDCPQDQVNSGIQGWLYRNFKYFLNLDTRCIRLNDFVYINVDGFVRPCCALTKYHMGNILEQELETIWKGERFNKFRKNYHNIPWCARCDFARLKQVNGDVIPVKQESS